MKKVFSFCFFILLFNTAFCQLYEKIKFGVQAGINVSNVGVRLNNIGFSYKASSIVGFNGGASATIPIAKGFYLQPEPSFSQLGAKIYPLPPGLYEQYLGNEDSSYVTVKSVLNYITLPLLLKYKLPVNGLGLFVGIQYGFLIRATDKVSNGTKSVTLNSKSDYNKGDFSGLAGAEYFYRQA